MNRNSRSESYKESGVDIEAGYRAVELMKESVASTRTALSCDEIGGFGGAIDISSVDGNVLVSGTDGVGTKLKLAFLMDWHDTVGIDCVAMCVNDIICTGARPLLFLDYIACGKNIPEKIASIVKGVAAGCVEAGCALVGGETAEMPGFYNESEYDLAGFSTGIVRKDRMLDKKNAKEGDAIIALASSGVHSNGFSLVRKIFNIDSNPSILDKTYPELGESLGEALLRPTRIYVRPVLKLLENVCVKSISHITGGGFFENIPRSLPEGLMAAIDKKDVKVLPIFKLIEKEGEIPERDMFNTFNMGVGMSIVVDRADEEKAIKLMRSIGFEAYHLGYVEKGSEGVRLW